MNCATVVGISRRLTWRRDISGAKEFPDVIPLVLSYVLYVVVQRAELCLQHPAHLRDAHISVCTHDRPTSRISLSAAEPNNAFSPRERFFYASGTSRAEPSRARRALSRAPVSAFIFYTLHVPNIGDTGRCRR